jgi:hypothetical protein
MVAVVTVVTVVPVVTKQLNEANKEQGIFEVGGGGRSQKIALATLVKSVNSSQKYTFWSVSSSLLVPRILGSGGVQN